MIPIGDLEISRTNCSCISLILLLSFFFSVLFTFEFYVVHMCNLEEIFPNRRLYFIFVSVFIHEDDENLLSVRVVVVVLVRAHLAKQAARRKLLVSQKNVTSRRAAARCGRGSKRPENDFRRFKGELSSSLSTLAVKKRARGC